MVSCIKIGQQMAEMKKRAKLEKNHGFLMDFLFDFWEK
jgi:hypothetical protein